MSKKEKGRKIPRFIALEVHLTDTSSVFDEMSCIKCRRRKRWVLKVVHIFDDPNTKLMVESEPQRVTKRTHQSSNVLSYQLREPRS